MTLVGTERGGTRTRVGGDGTLQAYRGLPKNRTMSPGRTLMLGTLSRVLQICGYKCYRSAGCTVRMCVASACVSTYVHVSFDGVRERANEQCKCMMCVHV